VSAPRDAFLWTLACKNLAVPRRSGGNVRYADFWFLRLPIVTPEQTELVRQSFDAIWPVRRKLADQFYRRFFELAPDAQALFRSDMERQYLKLMDMIAAIEDGDRKRWFKIKYSSFVITPRKPEIRIRFGVRGAKKSKVLLRFLHAIPL
jgi:hypothetical protein